MARRRYSNWGFVFSFEEGPERRRIKTSFSAEKFAFDLRVTDSLSRHKVTPPLYQVCCRAIRARRHYVCHPVLYRAYDALCEHLYIHHRRIYSAALQAVSSVWEDQCQRHPF